MMLLGEKIVLNYVCVGQLFSANIPVVKNLLIIWRTSFGKLFNYEAFH